MKEARESRFCVLFVCGMNKKRSLTAERIFRNDPRLKVRSAGVRQGAMRRVSQADLDWADVVYVMETTQKIWIAEEFRGLRLPRIEVLGIPDDFEAMDPELIAILKGTLNPEFDRLSQWIEKGRKEPGVERQE